MQVSSDQARLYRKTQDEQGRAHPPLQATEAERTALFMIRRSTRVCARMGIGAAAVPLCLRVRAQPLVMRVNPRLADTGVPVFGGEAAVLRTMKSLETPCDTS